MPTHKWNPNLALAKDGNVHLLWFPKSNLSAAIAESVGSGLAIDGWWFSSPKQIDDGWETAFGSIGEPTGWMDRYDFTL